MSLPAYSQIGKTFSPAKEMNGIRLDNYKNFQKNWRIVTVRFRKDTDEMRFTYANELAWKTLSEGSINYPDGAVFTKIGAHTGSDPQFESSAVPLGIRRYQVMLRDKKKYAATGGWGYALFDPEGMTFPEDPELETQACYACHLMVENRGDVFSRPFNLASEGQFYFDEKSQAKLTFNAVKVVTLPEVLKNLLVKISTVKLLRNTTLEKNVFQGTLDELRPILLREAAFNKMPAAFMAADKKRFVMVIPTVDKSCPDKAFLIYSTDLKMKVIKKPYCAL